MSTKNCIKLLILSIAIFWIIAALLIRAACSAELSFSWTPNAAGADGYRLLMDSGTNVIQEIPGAMIATTTVTVSDECHSFAILAYGIGGQSALSDFATWCPPAPDRPITPGTFLITIAPVP